MPVCRSQQTSANHQAVTARLRSDWFSLRLQVDQPDPASLARQYSTAGMLRNGTSKAHALSQNLPSTSEFISDHPLSRIS